MSRQLTMKPQLDGGSPEASLTSKTTNSVVWSVVRTGWSTAVSFGVFALLARMLGPADFGRFALASLVFELGKTVGNAGLAEAVMRERSLDARAADSVFWAQLLFSALVGAALFVGAPFYEAMTDSPGVASLVQMLAPMLPITALGAIHVARMAQSFDHRRLAMQALMVNTVAGGAAVVGAMAGLGAYCLVLQAAVISLLGTGTSWRLYRWVPGLQVDAASLRGHLRFGVSMMATQLMWTLTARLQEPLIGRTHGPEAVGQYRVAWRLIELIGQTILAPISNVALVALSKLQAEPARFASGFQRLVVTSALLTLPLLLLFGALAPEIIDVVFGPRWDQAATLAEILVLVAVPFVINYISGPALAAIGRPGWVLIVAIVQCGLTMLLTALAAPYGLAAVAGAYVARAYLTTPLQLWMLDRAVGRGLVTLWRPLLPVVAIAGVTFGAVWLGKAHLPSNHHAVLVALAIASLVVYAGLLLTLQRQQVMVVVEPIMNRFKPYLSRSPRERHE